VSASGRNPAWERDELILALDLYLQCGRKVLDDTDPQVVELSDLLNQLPIHPVRPDAGRFRNANGVALKLANFRAIDVPGTGMASVGRRDREVWDEFANDPRRLHRLAQAIRAGYRADAAQPGSESDDEEGEFSEGKVAYRLHRHRERSRELVRAKKAQVKRTTGSLKCEVCLFDFELVYGEVGKDYIECHHTLAVSELPDGATTRLEDVVVVCSNCHRMIHRRKPWLAIDAIRQLVVGRSAMT